jgi:DNA polymerase-3 subunit beta
MKFSVASNELGNAIHKVIGIVPNRSTIPILSNLLLSTEDGKIKVTATDLEITLISWALASIEEEGEITLPARILNDIIRALPETEMVFSVDDNHRISITTKSGEYKIGGEAKEDYPALPELDSEEEILLPAESLKRMVEKTYFACSTDELRPALTGVLFNASSNSLEMVATDGHRLVRVINSDIHSPIQKREIIPTTALDYLLKGISSKGEQSILFGENHILFRLPDFLIYSRIIKEPYPDYERVIPTGNSKEMIVPRQELLAATRRVSIFASQITNQIRLTINANEVVLVAEDVDFGGQGKESVPANFNAEAFEIGYNATYLMDVLKHLDTGEVRFLLENPTGAGLIMPLDQREDEELLMLLMPVKLNN